MKSIKKNLCGCIIHIVEVELGKNSQFFVEISIMTRPPIYSKINFHSTKYIILEHEEIYVKSVTQLTPSECQELQYI